VGLAVSLYVVEYGIAIYDAFAMYFVKKKERERRGVYVKKNETICVVSF
jgi:hypothetical protein